MDAVPVSPEGTPSAEDLAAIRRAALDYIESWYAADEERMRGCLHPDLVKRTLWHDLQQSKWILSRTLDGPMMVDRTRQGGGSDVPVPDRIQEITVLEGFRHIATAKVLSTEYVDYLHIAKFDDRWLITHALWELRQGEIHPKA